MSNNHVNKCLTPNRSLVRMGFLLVGIATLTTELALALPGQPLLTRFGAATLLLAWSMIIHAFVSRQANRETFPSIGTMLATVGLLGVLWGADLCRELWLSNGLPLELLMVLLIRNAALSAIALGRNGICLRISGGLSLAAMLFASILTEHRLVYPLLTLYALLGSYWLILLYWSMIEVRLLEGRSGRPPVLAILVWGLLVGLLTILVTGPRQTLGALAELLNTSGGTTQADANARSGVGDGDNLVKGIDDPQSSGPVDSDIFLETQERSLYDSSNDRWGEPEPIQKRQQGLAVAVDNGSDQELEERSRQPNPAREFSVVRSGRKRSTPPPNLQANAAYFVKGKTPLHLRLVAFETFDGRRWREPTVAPLDAQLHKSLGGWIVLPESKPEAEPITFGGRLRHEFLVGRIDAPQVPLPTQARKFRIDRVDRPDFFREAQPGIICYRGEGGLPRQTVVETDSATIDPALLRTIKFDKKYALPKYFVIDARSKVADLEESRPIDPRIPALARSWVEGIDPGWEQVEAVVAHLRREFELDPAADPPPHNNCPVAHFLFNQQRGDDYAFATAACLLLRSLGYPARFVQGLYADPRRFDPNSGQTAILMPESLHTWVEVQLPNQEWVVVEPTPGFNVLGPEQTWLAWALNGVFKSIQWIGRHPWTAVLVILTGLASIAKRRQIFAILATLRWRWSFQGSPRDQVLATLRLLEQRSALAGRRRPAGTTVQAWYRPMTETNPDQSIGHLLRLADQALYAPGFEIDDPATIVEDVKRPCQDVARQWTMDRLRLADNIKKSDRRNHKGIAAALVLLVGLTLSMSSTKVTHAQQIEFGTIDNHLEVFTEDIDEQEDELTLSDMPKPIGLSTWMEEVGDPTPAERISGLTMQVISAIWFFVLGAVVGSFLNVVVYRMPRGLPLTGRKSHCPTCGIDLTFYENMPILGWIRVKGRCRSCGVRISPRYPVVEFVTGLIFLVLLQVELLSGGGSLPVRSPNIYAGVVWILWYPKWDLIGIYLYHCFLLCSLLCMTLIVADGWRIPKRLWVSTLLVGLIGPIAFPDLRPVPFSVSEVAWSWIPAPNSRLGELFSGLLGLSSGALLGILLIWTGPRRLLRPGQSFGLALTIALGGLFLGWQAAISLTLIGLVLEFPVRHIGGRIIPKRLLAPRISFLSIAVLIQLLLWRSLSEIPYWPSHASTPVELILALSGILMLNFVARFLQPRFQTQSIPSETIPEPALTNSIPQITHDSSDTIRTIQ